jgi:hypothetical protein
LNGCSIVLLAGSNPDGQSGASIPVVNVAYL